MNKKTVKDIQLDGKKVLVRVDYNVPFRPNTTDILDDSRITASLPTIRYLLEKRCAIILCSHLGRPNGKVVDEMRMTPVSKRLSQLLNMPVIQTTDCIGPEVKEKVKALGSGQLMMLENLRFHPEEEKNNPMFAAELASMAEVYVNDAFGTAHRAHASTEGVTKYLPSVAGLLMAKELEMLGSVLQTPRHPFMAIFGGAKVSDKIAILDNLAPKADKLLIGGGMAATFLKAKGIAIGASLVEDDRIETAAKLLKSAKGLVLPEDVVIADAFAENADRRTVKVTDIPSGWRIMDIGPKTIKLFKNTLATAKTVVWNGPMGVAEWEPFLEGTAQVAKTLASLSGATTVLGGGSTAEVVGRLGLEDKMTHVSTGGGASLEFLEGKTLPGVAALLDK